MLSLTARIESRLTTVDPGRDLSSWVASETMSAKIKYSKQQPQAPEDEDCSDLGGSCLKRICPWESRVKGPFSKRLHSANAFL